MTARTALIDHALAHGRDNDDLTTLEHALAKRTEDALKESLAQPSSYFDRWLSTEKQPCVALQDWQKQTRQSEVLMAGSLTPLS